MKYIECYFKYLGPIIEQYLKWKKSHDYTRNNAQSASEECGSSTSGDGAPTCVNFPSPFKDNGCGQKTNQSPPDSKRPVPQRTRGRGKFDTTKNTSLNRRRKR